MAAKNIYMIGIKGVGMTMLAQFLACQGNKISGSDVSESFMTDKVLADTGIKVLAPFAAANLPASVDLVIYSSAFTAKNNPELAALAKMPAAKRPQMLSYAEALGAEFSAQKGIAVCGSHGKTTVSAWLGYVLWKSGKKPNVLVGSRVPQFKGSSLSGRSDIFVAETDEYQNKLQYFQPDGVVLNNIDYDHPDFFPTEADYVKVFAEFLKKIPKGGFFIMNNRDVQSRRIVKYCRGRIAKYDVADEAYSGETVNYLAHSLKLKGGNQYFEINNLGEFKIRLWGRHNIFNALAVVAAARELGVPLTKIKEHLFGFTGTERRAEFLGNYRGAKIIDDYAHHPTEIRTTIAGVKARYPKQRLRVIFHPHTFTRTKALFADFSQSFADAQELVILDIYGSAREKQGGVSSLQLVKAVEKVNKQVKRKQQVSNVKDIEAAIKYLRASAKPGDIILLMGAGDVFRVGQGLLYAQHRKK